MVHFPYFCSSEMSNVTAGTPRVIKAKAFTAGATSARAELRIASPQMKL